MKYLTLSLLIIFTFQASYAQVEEESVTGPLIVEEDSGEVGSGPVSSEDVEPSFFETDPTGQRVVEFGNQWLLSQLIGYKWISDTDSWAISSINAGTRAVSPAGGIQYTYYAGWSNDAGETFNSDVTVRYDELFSLIEVVSYGYLPPAVSAVSEEDLQMFEFGDETITVTITPIDGEAIFEENNTGEEVIPGGWTTIPLEQAMNDPAIMELVNQGGQAAIQKGSTEGTIPSGTWSAPTLLSAESQVVAGTNYYFTASFASDANLEARAGYFVFQDLDGNVEVVSSGFWYLAPFPV